MHRVLWASQTAGRFRDTARPTEIADAALGGRLRPETATAMRRASTGGPGRRTVIDESGVPAPMSLHARHRPAFRAAASFEAAGALTASTVLPSVLFARTGGPERLVVVILRGALDGLAAVPPHGDPDYARLIGNLPSRRRVLPTAHWPWMQHSACTRNYSSCTNATPRAS